MTSIIRVTFEKMPDVKGSVELTWVMENPVTSCVVRIANGRKILPNPTHCQLIGWATCHPEDEWNPAEGMKRSLKSRCDADYDLKYQGAAIYKGYRFWAFLQRESKELLDYGIKAGVINEDVAMDLAYISFFEGKELNDLTLARSLQIKKICEDAVFGKITIQKQRAN